MAHSLSPVIHEAGFASTGALWSYVAFEVAPGDAGRAIEAMRTLHISGLSVTTPHKEAVAEAVDELAPQAAVLRSVNTVAMSGDGRLVGYSTDGAGFVASLAERGIELAGAKVTVLGAGAAARSVVDAVGRAGAERIAIVNRTPAAAEVAAQLAAVAVVGSDVDIEAADVLVNATTVGMGSDAIPCDPGRLRATQVVADLVYHPRQTALLLAARDAGASTVDGLGMLVHQAALQQELWTGQRPDAVAMRRAAEAELISQR